VKVRVFVTLKQGVLDPQGKAIEGALHGLGFDGVSGVRQGKMIEMDVDAGDEAAAKAEAEKMCAALLANPVMESYRVEVGA
jgi:phosphoribosylformylglycinamidine synthase PurS subunit